MAVISMKQFLDAGVHFGHQTKRWHPKMSPYIYGIKNGVHVIDLRQTLKKLKEAYEYVKASAEEGRVPLFVGTKTQIQKIVKEEATRCGSPYINFRWLGGLLTNFGTVKQSVARMKSFEELAGEDGSYEGFIKKEALIMERKRLKLERSLGGVRNMNSIPSILFITDCHKEQLALKEAQKLGITVIGVSDTNCDPTGIEYLIPGNDDSPRAVSLYANVISTAVIEGLSVRRDILIKEDKEKKQNTKKIPPQTKDAQTESKIENNKVKISLGKNKKTPSKAQLKKTENDKIASEETSEVINKKEPSQKGKKPITEKIIDVSKKIDSNANTSKKTQSLKEINITSDKKILEDGGEKQKNKKGIPSKKSTSEEINKGVKK